jgi:hypothetical protein
VTRVKLLNRRRLTRSPTAVVNCSLPVTALHADLLTYIHARNGFRGITNERPSPSVPTLNVSGNDTTSLTFASESISLASESDFLPDTHPRLWIMACNGENVWLLPAIQHASTWPRDTAEKRCANHPESESLFKKEIMGELRLPRASSQSVDACAVGKMEGMCKLLPRTMQDFALKISEALSLLVQVCTKCFRKLGEGGSRRVHLASFSGP